MSHVHCPACRYAFNALTSATCPRCAWSGPRRAEARPLDAMAEVDAALDRLAVALARLAGDELDAVAMRLVSTEHDSTWAGVIASAIAGAVLARRAEVPAIQLELEAPEAEIATTEEPPLSPRERALFTLALALLARLAAVTREAATRFRWKP